jgi:hypothetical protein
VWAGQIPFHRFEFLLPGVDSADFRFSRAGLCYRHRPHRFPRAGLSRSRAGRRPDFPLRAERAGLIFPAASQSCRSDFHVRLCFSAPPVSIRSCKVFAAADFCSPGPPRFGPPAGSRSRSRFFVGAILGFGSHCRRSSSRLCRPCGSDFAAPGPFPRVGLAAGVRPSCPHRCSFRVSSLSAARSSSAAREQPLICLVLRAGRISACSFIFPLERAVRFSISCSFLLCAADLLSSLIFAAGPGLVFGFVILFPQEVPPQFLLALLRSSICVLPAAGLGLDSLQRKRDGD